MTTLSKEQLDILDQAMTAELTTISGLFDAKDVATADALVKKGLLLREGGMYRFTVQGHFQYCQACGMRDDSK